MIEYDEFLQYFHSHEVHLEEDAAASRVAEGQCEKGISWAVPGHSAVAFRSGDKRRRNMVEWRTSFGSKS